LTRNELKEYWRESASEDLAVMESLFDKGHYAWALFIGHLVLEKTLKALYVQNTESDVPFVHNLLKIAREAMIPLTDEQEEFLLEITAYNIRGRYPDYQREFQRTATQEYTGRQLARIREAREWLISLMIPE
jgi:HEPN domain-containing protein